MYKFTNKETGAQVSAMKFTKECLDQKCIINLIFDDFAKSLFYTASEYGIKLYNGLEVGDGCWIVKNHEGFYFPIAEQELIDKYNFLDAFKSHKYNTSITITPFFSGGEFCEKIRVGDGTCEVKSFELSDETLTSPIPSVMVEGCKEMMNEVGTKTFDKYWKTI